MPHPRTSLRQFETFVTVAELLSFSAAAARLSLTPSAVSQLVVELESAVGFRLFDRSTRKVALSGAGQQFLASAESVVRHARLAESAADDVRNGAAGIVRVAAPMVIASAVLPAAIRAHAALHPEVVVRIRDAPVDRIVDDVAGADADLAIGPDRSSGDEIERVALFRSPWVLWCAPDHPLAAKKQLRWSDLRAHALVAAGRDHERSVAQMRAGLPDDERITPIDVVDHISTALGIASAGIAATLSPAYVGVWAERFGLVMRRIVAPESVREVCLYRPARRATSPAARAFGAHLQRWLPAWHRAQQKQMKPAAVAPKRA